MWQSKQNRLIVSNKDITHLTSPFIIFIGKVWRGINQEDFKTPYQSCLQNVCSCIAGCLQVVYRSFAAREPYLEFSSDFMPFLLNMRGSEKKHVTDLPTDKPSYGDPWSHLKQLLSEASWYKSRYCRRLYIVVVLLWIGFGSWILFKFNETWYGSLGGITVH